ncbi:MAG: hypothetical protein HFJ58_00180 [Clostridia bacterium]|nr:hypothetical protein [Clostridia bacterium]
MQKEIEPKKTSPTFSVRIDITAAENEITFIGNGDKYAGELFLKVLRRLEERMKRSEEYTETFYDVDNTSENKIEIRISNEDLEQLLQAILLL